MNDKCKELAIHQINNNLVKEIQIKSRAIIKTIEYEKVVRNPGKWWTREIISHNLPIELLQIYQNSINCYYGDYEINWNHLAELINTVTEQARTKTIAICVREINSTANGYLEIIENLKMKTKREIEREKEKNQATLVELQQLKTAIEDYKSSRERILKNSNRLITSKERIELEEIRNKYQKLEQSNSTLTEQLQVNLEKNEELENSLEILENNFQVLSQELDAAIARWEIANIDLGLAQSKIAGLNSKVESLEAADHNWEEIYNNETYNVTILKDFIIRIATLIEDYDEDINDKLKIIKGLEIELAKTKIKLTGTQQDLVDIQRLNFESKLKLQGVLFCDSLRTFLPNIFNQGLTAIETTIFVSSITNHPTIEKISWISLALYFSGSVIFASYKLSSYLKAKITNLVRKMRNKK